MMQLCDEKGCWLSDLDDVPGSELTYWMAYYEEKERLRKQQEARDKAKAHR